MLDYAKKNVNNKKLSSEDRTELKIFIKNSDLSELDTKEIKKFRQKHKAENIKNNEILYQQYQELYNKYENAYWEIDADNVALALQYYIGNANSQILKDYLGIVLSSENGEGTQRNIGTLGNIRAFNARRKRENSQKDEGVFRLSHIVDTQTFYQILYQETNDDKLIAGYTYPEVGNKLSELTR